MGHGRSNQDQDARYSNAARRYGAAIERLARGYEADAELRRDLVQEIHAALWRSYSYFEGQCSERSWVYRIAHNVAVSHLIARQRDALAGIFTWYLLPFIPGLLVMTLGPTLEHGGVGVLLMPRLVWIGLILPVAIVTGIWLLNQRGARLLQKRIDDIDALMGRNE